MKFKHVILGITALMLLVSCNPQSSSNGNSTNGTSNTSQSSNDGDSTTSSHTHTFASGWEHDETYHWHKSTCGHDVVDGKIEHTFKEEVTNPTYDAEGYTTHTCTVCEYSYVDSETSKLTHNYSSTWSSDKDSHWHACTDNGYESLKGYEAKHDFKDTVTPATYDAEGYTTHTCSVCNYSYKDNETSKLTHNYSSTWSSDKDSHWHACTDNGYETLKGYEAKHDFKDTVTPATYDAEGYTTHTCSVCNYSYKDNETSKLTHNYASTWSSDKDSHWHACTDNGYETLKGYEAKHDFKDTVTPATYDAEGYTTHTCSVCNYSYKDNETSKLTHNYASTWSSDKDSHWHACIDVGYESLKSDVSEHDFTSSTESLCSVCGYSIYDKYLIFSVNDDNKSYSISDCNIYFEGPLTIPSTHKGYPVTSIGPSAFSNCSSLTSITIPNSVTSIGMNAFSKCSSLASISIPDSVTSIGEHAFSNCSSLTSITIPNSITSIGDGTFSNCSSLASISIPDSVTSIGENAFYGCDSLIYNELDDVKYLGNNANSYLVLYKASASASNVTIPEGTKFIKGYAFYNCHNLTSISIPSSVTYIGPSAFYGCSSLTSIIIPDGVTSIGPSAFYGCKALTSIVIPNGVTSIGVDAFYDCKKLTSIDIPDSVTSIGMNAFSKCSSLTSITIPNSVTSIGPSAFYGCSSLTSIIIPSCVTSIEDNTFYGCKALTSIVIPNGVTSIGENAFSNCSSLVSIKVDEGNKIYDSRNDCNALIETSTNTLITGCQNTIIPDGVTSIGDWAFYGCKDLTSIVIPDGVTSIGDCAFYDCSSLTSITIPNSVTSIGNSAFYGCKASTSIVIPNSVTSIGPSAFSNCSSLTSITIPNAITTIGEFAFYGCSSLASISIPDSVTSIGSYAFYECSSLTSITIPSCVTSIEDNTFYGCKALTSIVIPNGVTSIGENAFYECSSLTSIIIPSSVTLIDSNVFYNCSSLAKIYYSGTPEQWNGINISFFNNNLKSVTKYFFTDNGAGEKTSGHWWYYDGDGNIKEIIIL